MLIMGRCFMDPLNFMVFKNTVNKYFSFSKVFGTDPFCFKNLGLTCDM